ncbi:hypothetical protein D3C77_696920 [compost metagenome]
MPRQVLDQADAIAIGVVAGHGVVGDDYVRRVAFQVLDQRGRPGQGGRDLEIEILFQQVAHSHQDQGMVVDQDDTESFHAGVCLQASPCFKLGYGGRTQG